MPESMIARLARRARPRRKKFEVRLEVPNYQNPIHVYQQNPPGYTVGDVDVWVGDFHLPNDPKVFGQERSTWTIMDFPAGAQYGVQLGVAVHKWPGGDLAVQILQDYDPPPNPPYRYAITGGTGLYKGARGEITFVDYNNITFRFKTL